MYPGYRCDDNDHWTGTASTLDVCKERCFNSRFMTYVFGGDLNCACQDTCELRDSSIRVDYYNTYSRVGLSTLDPGIHVSMFYVSDTWWGGGEKSSSISISESNAQPQMIICGDLLLMTEFSNSNSNSKKRVFYRFTKRLTLFPYAMW